MTFKKLMFIVLTTSILYLIAVLGVSNFYLIILSNVAYISLMLMLGDLT